MGLARLVVGGITVAGVGFVASTVARRRADARAADAFYDWDDATEEWPETDGIPARAPAYVNHLESFGSFHAASLAAVVRALPSDDLYPVRMPDGRAIVFIGANHYRDITNAAFDGPIAPPFGEVTVALVVTREPAPPALPLAGRFLPLPEGWRMGLFGLFLPITHRWARDGGLAMGIPKFIADLDFEESETARQVTASEGGRRILQLRVPVAGSVRASHDPMPQFSALDGGLYEVDVRIFAHERMGVGGRGVELVLGDHPVADEIRELGVDTRALATTSWVSGRAIMPTMRRVGRARPFTGYPGEDRWFGRYTIAYPGTRPVDQYAYLTREGIERAVRRGGGRVLDDYAALDDELDTPRAAGRRRARREPEKEVASVG